MQPLVELYAIEAQLPSLKDNTGDLDRLRRAVAERFGGREPVVPFGCLPRVAGNFRRAGFVGGAVVNNLPSGPELVDFVVMPAKPLVGIALDLGTTHLEAVLVELASGRRLAEADCENGQLEFGADILSRIHYAAQPGGLAALHSAVISCVNELAADLADRAGTAVEEIRALSVSGNTAMVHFFLKFDPYHLIREPYIPLVNVPDPCRALELGLAIDPGAPVWVVPGVGSYFGGDLVSGVVASGLARGDKVSMLIDVGTNAEVIVGNREWLIACAGAAGPALEGGVVRMGMRAGPGAVARVEIDPASGGLTYQTIGGARPKGICGSGIIDLVAGLYLGRFIDIRGKFRPGRNPARFVETAEGLAFVLVDAAESADGKPVLFGQVDLDAVMRSKAAMYSILTTLVNQVGIGFDELERIYVAGAFGRHISPRQAITLGMLPDLPLAVFKPIGNSSLAGAEMVLLDGAARRECRELVRKITYLELNVNQEFMTRFSGCRFIPHTDATLFPSVPFLNGD
ncbi:MAG: ASKHA domain-containing protein [Desulfurivibrionaceae bacterium]|nr:ASKHA domain-containing protein [Desulfobulbales bacterium]MDT8334406.1 ASKHA domain-containing protein [Desulfurivibrionaceae bacterium]